MAQHCLIEAFKDEKWYSKIKNEIEKSIEEKIGKKGKYFSIYDNQCGVFFYSGRNSKSKMMASWEIVSLFEDLVICGCGTEMQDYDDVCDECGFKVSTYIDKITKHAKENPDDYVSSNDGKIIEHEYPILEDMELEDLKIPMENGLKAQTGLTIFPEDRVENAIAYGYHSKLKSRISKDDDLRICDIGFEIHVGNETQIYLVA